MARKGIIRAEIDSNTAMQALGDNYPAVAALFNERPQVANPAPQQQVAKRLGIRDLFGAITPAEARALYMIPGYRDDVQEAAEAGDRVALQMYVGIAASDLSQQSLAALAALMQATEPDPAWTATIPGDSIAMTLGLGVVRAADVQEALN
jgi:hypothetical protein